jgi:hypothetical protein
MLKSLILSLFICTFSGIVAQSDWKSKPYVLVNDTNYIQVKHPVFIMDSTLYIRTKTGREVLTFPTKDINYISKRCFYQRLTEGQKNRLSNSLGANAYFSGTLFSVGVIFLGVGINEYIWYSQNSYWAEFYSPANLIAGVSIIIPAALLIRSMILKKLRNRMIIESKGIRLTQLSGQGVPLELAFVSYS